MDEEPVEARPISVPVKAVDYKQLEMRIVPEADRRAEKYGGFYLSIRTADLNRKFRLVR